MSDVIEKLTGQGECCHPWIDQAIAEIERLRAKNSSLLSALKLGEHQAFLDAAKMLRAECNVCKGTGHFEWDGSDPAECEYCGRPMEVLHRAAEGVKDE